MNDLKITYALEALLPLFNKNIDCYSVKGRGKATENCDIAIDSLLSEISFDSISDLIGEYWVETVPYDSHLSRHKFRVQ